MLLLEASLLPLFCVSSLPLLLKLVLFMKEIFANILNSVSIKSDAIYLLHELMYQPKGNMKLSEIRRKHIHWLNCEPRIVLMYCSQQSFISLDKESAQLTNHGLDYYLANVSKVANL